MSRQGNYVTVPGGSANWTKGISDSLTALSKSYIGQGDAEEERARLAAAAEENKRRFEIEQAYKEAEAQRTAAFRQAQLDATSARDAATVSDREARLALLQSEEDRKQAVHDQTVADAATARENDTILGSFTVPNNLDILGPNAQGVWQTQNEGLAAQRADADANIELINTRRNFLTPEGALSPEGQAEFDRRFAVLSQALPEEEARSRAMNQVTTMRDNALNSNYETDINAFLTNQERDLGIAASRLPYLATQEEFIRYGQQQLAEAGHTAPMSAEVRQDLAARAEARGLPKAADLIASGQAADVAKYERAVEQAKLFDNYYTRRQAASSNGGRTSSTGMDASDFNEFVNNLDGWGQEDKQQAIQLLTNLSQDPEVQSAGIPVSVLREAILLTSFEGTLTDNRTVDPENPTDVTNVVNLAKALNSGSTTGRTFINKSDYTLPEVTGRSAADILGGRVSSAIPTRTASLPTMYESLAMPDLTALQSEVADRNLAAQAAAAEEAAVAREALATTAAAKADAIQAGDTTVAPLTRGELSVLPSTSRLPNTAEVNMDSLPTILGEAFDLNSSDRGVARASRDLLTTQQDLDMLNRELLNPSTSEQRKQLLRDVYIPQTANMRYLQRRELLELSGQ
jgi:hypothetical protein